MSQVFEFRFQMFNSQGVLVDIEQPRTDLGLVMQAQSIYRKLNCFDVANDGPLYILYDKNKNLV